MSQEDSAFETHDINLAAYLSVAGCELKNRRKQGNRVFFVFTNAAGEGSIQKLREDYFSGRGKVVASTFAEAIRRMKEMCFE